MNRIVSGLLRLGAFAAVLTLTGCGPEVLRATMDGNAQDLERELNMRGANPNVQGEHGRSALHIAVGKGDLKKVKVLIAHKADPNIQDAIFKTPLMYAAERGFYDISLALMAAGANVNARTPDDRGIALRNFNPLMFAAMNGHQNIAQELVKHGADVLAQDSNLQTASAWAKRINADLWRYLDNEETKQRESKESGAEAAVKEIPSDVDEPKYNLPENKDNFALVIGIENYVDIPHADYAQHDAHAVRAHLMAMGYPTKNIITLTGPHATKTGIEKYVKDWLPRMVKDDSTVFFYYSGHGAPDTKSGQAYLIPFDGDPQFLDATAYPVKQLYSQLNALKAKQIIVAMDSCFSGAGGRSVLPKGARPLVNKIDMGTQAVEEDKTGKIVAFSASQADQISGALDDQHHGAFTYYFLRGLNGAASDKYGNVTAKSLYDYLKPSVEDTARRQNREQIPMLMPDSPQAGGVRLK